MNIHSLAQRSLQCLLVAAVLSTMVGCEALYDTSPGRPHGYSSYSSQPYRPVTSSSASSDNSSALAGVALLGLLGAIALSGSGSSGSDDYQACEYCSEPVGFSGRWCPQHEGVVQEQMDQGR